MPLPEDRIVRRPVSLHAQAESAIQRSEENANAAWKEAALGAIFHCAETHALFTVDEVWPFVPPEVQTPDDRALGPVMRNAAANGWIEQSGEFRRSWLRNHGTPRPLWRSRVYKSSGSDEIERKEPLKGWDGKHIPTVGDPLWLQLTAALDKRVAASMLGSIMETNITPKQVQARLAKAWKLILASLDLSWPTDPGRLDPAILGPMSELTEGWNTYATHLRRLAWERDDFWRTHLMASKRITQAQIAAISNKVTLEHLPTTIRPSENLWLAWESIPSGGRKNVLRLILLETTRGNNFTAQDVLSLESVDGEWRSQLPIPKRLIRIDQDHPLDHAIIRAAEWAHRAWVERGPRSKRKKGGKKSSTLIHIIGDE